MKSVRSVAASVLLVLFVSVGSLAAAGGSGQGSTEGTFVGIEQGDPARFLIKEKDGSSDSFAIRRPADKSVQPYLDNPAKFKGRSVKVYWYKKFANDSITTTVVRVE